MYHTADGVLPPTTTTALTVKLRGRDMYHTADGVLPPTTATALTVKALRRWAGTGLTLAAPEGQRRRMGMPALVRYHDLVKRVCAALHMLADGAAGRSALVVRARVQVALDLLLTVLAPPRVQEGGNKVRKAQRGFRDPTMLIRHMIALGQRGQGGHPMQCLLTCIHHQRCPPHPGAPCARQHRRDSPYPWSAARPGPHPPSGRKG